MPATATTKLIRYDRLPKTFEALCRFHPLRPIHDVVELDNATEIIDAMAGHDLNADQADYLDAIATLVDRWESEHDPVDTSNVTGSALLRSLIESNDLSAGKVAEIIGVDRSLVSHVLAGRRGVTWDHAKVLGEYFGLPPAVFMD